MPNSERRRRSRRKLKRPRRVRSLLVSISVAAIGVAIGLCAGGLFGPRILLKHAAVFAVLGSAAFLIQYAIFMDYRRRKSKYSNKAR